MVTQGVVLQAEAWHGPERPQDLPGGLIHTRRRWRVCRARTELGLDSSL